MKEEFVTLKTGDGPMTVFVAHPEHRGPHPAMLVIMEAFGVNHHIQNVCRHFAQEGYLAAAPDIYHRQGNHLVYAYDDMKPVMAALGNLTDDGIGMDVQTTLNYVREQPHVDRQRVGVVGYCVGGFAAFLTACRTDVATTIAYYGGGIVTTRQGFKIQPLLPEAGNIRQPILLFFGAQDQSITADQVKAIDDTLTTLNKVHTIKVYPDAGHGFNCDERGSYRPEDAADAWRMSMEWLTTHMPAGR